MDRPSRVPAGASTKSFQQPYDPWERLAVLEMLQLKFSHPLRVFFMGDWELSPFLEQSCRIRPWPALQLCFETPRKIRATMFAEDDVSNIRVNVFGIQKKAVHIEETASHRWKAKAYKSAEAFDSMTGPGGFKKRRKAAAHLVCGTILLYANLLVRRRSLVEGSKS